MQVLLRLNEQKQLVLDTSRSHITGDQHSHFGANDL